MFRCWIGEQYEHDRLLVHYLWIFMAELGSLCIYIYIFIYLYIKVRSLDAPPSTQSNTQNTQFDEQNANDPYATTKTVVTTGPPTHDPFTASRNRLLRTARYMVVYPFAYVALSLPLAAGRVSTMAGRSPPLAYYCVAGTLMATCGLADVLLYLTTRRAIIRSEVGIRRTKHSRAESESHGMENVESRRHDETDAPVSVNDTCDGPHANEMQTDSAFPQLGSIMVSRSIDIRDEETSKGPQVIVSPTTSGRTDSLKSLVTKENDSGRSSW